MNDKPVIIKKRPGQPRKLFADEKTLSQLKGMGSIMATTRECAAILNVHHDTLMEFFNRNPIAREMYQDGKEQGRMSLRRNQFKMAEHNATMLIWLGKQYLDQSDKQELTGKDGNPIEVRTLADFYGGYLPKPTAGEPEGDPGA